MMLRSMLCFVVAATVSGCSIGVPSSAEISGSGVASGAQSQTASCGTVVQLERYFAGSGGAQIEVTDGAGHSVYATPADISGEINDSQKLTGAAGTWTLTVDADGFAGQFKVTLDCI